MLLRVPMMLPPVRITLLRLLIMLLRVLISTFHATTGSTFHATTGTNNAVNATGDAANGRSGLAACTRSGTSRRGGRATLPQPTCRRMPTEQAEAAPLRRPQPPTGCIPRCSSWSRVAPICLRRVAASCGEERSGEAAADRAQDVRTAVVPIPSGCASCMCAGQPSGRPSRIGH